MERIKAREAINYAKLEKLLPDKKTYYSNAKDKSTNNPNGFYSNVPGIVEFNIDQELKRSKDFRRLLRKERGNAIHY